MGDLNAKAVAWGCPATNGRGETVLEFALSSGLVLLNQGSASTYVRQQGESIVDVTFATPALAACVQNWRVLESEETLSDHRYIRFEVSSSPGLGGTCTSTSTIAFPRWVLGRLDRAQAEEAAIVQAWCPIPGTLGVDDRANQLREALMMVCDAAMPRARKLPERKQVYWWSDNIASLRSACNISRRAYTRCRRRRIRVADEETLLYENYRQAKEALKVAIYRAKSDAWKEFIKDLDRDPWGRPYRTVRKQLCKQAPPTDSFDPQLLDRVVVGLFPACPPHEPPCMACPDPLPDRPEEIPPITEGEFGRAIHHLRLKKTAPGPDGVPGRVLALALKHLGSRALELFDLCLALGRFPQVWKDGRLCLLRKEGRPADSPSGYRPIILLDEVGKMLERIIAARIVQHLTSEGPDLSEAQYGFRTGRSTIDALLHIKHITQEAVARGERVLVVSLDIANAFNSLPYECIDEALRYHAVPAYLRNLVEHYVRGRNVIYLDDKGDVCARRMTAGVPQGSVMGPLLWNIGYNWALRGALLPRTHILCYADDTLFVARGNSHEEVAHLATVGSTLLVGRIRLLGFKVALSKTVAMSFYGKRGRPPAGAYIYVDGERIMVAPHIKYLGLTLDRAWNFSEHFQRLTPKIQVAAGSLARLLPNLGGPSAPCHRLFAGVIRSMALYGAPVWADALTPANSALLRKPQKIMAVKAIRGYRNVSHGAACAIAGSLPWDREAAVLAQAYRDKAERHALGDCLAPQEVGHARELARRAALQQWSEDMLSATYGRWTLDAIGPHLQEWVQRKHGTLTYRLVQVLSGHGCFGRYLHHIARRELSPACQHCGAAEDTAQHTLQECSAWTPQRQALEANVGRDLSLPSVVKAMLDSDRSWQAVVSFCEDVILKKETAERIWEQDPLAPSQRRRKPGRRRRQFHRLLLLDGGQQGPGARSPSPAFHGPPLPGDVPNVTRNLSPPQRGDRRVRLRRAITDRAAVESDREPVTLSGTDTPSNESSDDEWFDDALALR